MYLSTSFTLFKGLVFPKTAAKGIPWTLPDGVVNGVCKSAWASIHITPKSFPFKCLSIPAIVPIDEEWSPDNISGK